MYLDLLLRSTCTDAVYSLYLFHTYFICEQKKEGEKNNDSSPPTFVLCTHQTPNKTHTQKQTNKRAQLLREEESRIPFFLSHAYTFRYRRHHHRSRTTQLRSGSHMSQQQQQQQQQRRLLTVDDIVPSLRGTTMPSSRRSSSYFVVVFSLSAI